MIDFIPLDGSIISAFAESLTYNVSGSPKAVTGIVTRPGPILDEEMNTMRPRVSSPESLRISIFSSEVAAAGIGMGSTVVVDGKTYKVIRIWPDDGGMTMIEHRT